MKKEFPILEFDEDIEAIIDPFKINKKKLPKMGVLTFFNDVVLELEKKGEVRKLDYLRSEMGKHHIYVFNDTLDNKGKEIILFHPGIGAPLAAGLLEELIGKELEKVIVCGGAGVLDGGIDKGKVIIPIKAVRDEGTSYHYLPPERFVEQSKETVDAIEETLNEHKVEYKLGITWTTDAIFRETKKKIKLRRDEDKCITVEMEASALFSVAQFRGILLGQILYAGDDVSGEEWDNRNWIQANSIRKKLIYLSKEIVTKL